MLPILMYPKLRYEHPASSWNDALPLGNGRLGAMVYGGIHTETLRLNEESVWYGGPQPPRTPFGAKHHLEELRKLIRAGRHRDAESLVRKRFLATPKSARHYEPLGTCNIAFEYGNGNGKASSGGAEDIVKEYKRSLNLAKAEAVVKYTINGITVRREAIATNAGDVIAIRVVAASEISFTVSLTRMSDVEWEVNEFLDSIAIVNGHIVLHATPGGKNSNSLCLAVGARVDSNGSVEVVGRELKVTAKEALVVIAAHTQYRHENAQQAALADISTSFGLSTAELWKRHVEDWEDAYGRMSIQLYPDDAHLTTDARLTNNRDPGLVSLYFSYARYLLLSCSRPYPKALPATLQGIWNPSFQPPWGSKYTININLQMNYWIANTSNLSKCELPLFDLLERMAVNGQRTASDVWNCRGWCAHHSTDIFADTETQDRWMPATLWPLGGAWLCTHIGEHYFFTGDRDFLARMAPVLEGCVEFLLDFLVPDSSGKYLVTNPSLSPENTFRHKESGELGVFCEGSTMDMVIVRQVFSQYILATAELGEEILSTSIFKEVQTALGRLQPIAISPKTETVQEWGLNDYEETELGHRHVSHLYGLHPSNEITPTSTPELAEAARQTLLRRIAHGGGHTGWSRAWLINLWARLRQHEQCILNVDALMRDSTLPNMLDTHPPFQIDGNFGGAAGILECLVQSHEIMVIEGGSKINVIRLLPSCPADWEKGEVKGVKCRGGFELDFKWDHGEICEPVVVKSKLAKEFVLVFHHVGSDAKNTGTRISIPACKGECLVYKDGVRDT
ncbi:glycoside hydrolase family 95 protein [Cucurbitaria berberidis CBS 394.84]|uniref:Glycoside hydrolase family 95 protein n=1 Tax=Cucurbitaria berberidis CBS 394.84 TaxID=1168544 RepID=A0A9P4G9J2_9PLEO|nr:glycoside hydrolase family 95 protein [Cucurbitaria berberidis CBS 394.84]KAF1841515.1 glycoside hydrolase family 95 protein [Cucurbitaria berberidis CBS 394.84]